MPEVPELRSPARELAPSPPKHELLGVMVSATDYDEALELIMRAAQGGRGMTVDHMSVHGLSEASRDPSFRQVMNGLDLVVPDGQPVRWALNFLRGTELADRLYGPELMQRLCQRAAETGVGIYLYGGHAEVLDQLQANLRARFPALRIAGAEAPPFRPLTADEDRDTVERINRSGAGLVFLGLGCPKQEVFAYEHRHRIRAVQLCVGAAFDFHAGAKKMAPRWMQRRGLEWAFRLLSEPRRLVGRYALSIPVFLVMIALEIIQAGFRPARG